MYRSDGAESLHQHERPGAAERDETRLTKEAGAGDVSLCGKAIRSGTIRRLDHGLRWLGWSTIAEENKNRSCHHVIVSVHFCITVWGFAVKRQKETTLARHARNYDYKLQWKYQTIDVQATTIIVILDWYFQSSKNKKARTCDNRWPHRWFCVVKAVVASRTSASLENGQIWLRTISRTHTIQGIP